MNYKLILVTASLAALSAAANADLTYTLDSFSFAGATSGTTNLSSSPTTATPTVTLTGLSGYAGYSLDYTATSGSYITGGTLALTTPANSTGLYSVDIQAFTTTGTYLGGKTWSSTLSGGTLDFSFGFASTYKTVDFKTSEVFYGSAGSVGGGSSATPEPASYAVMGLGLVGLMIRRRRR